MEVNNRLLKCYIWSVLTYGCESWTLSKVMEKRLEDTEMWFYKKMLRIFWVQRVTNAEVLKKMKAKRQLTATIRERELALKEDGGMECYIIETEL